MRLNLSGVVTDNDSARLYRRWGYTGVCCPQDVRDALTNCPEGEDLILELNSGGGSAYQGYEMYSVIKGSGRNVRAEVQSIAGSAMSVIMAACSEVLMSPVANVMIHRAATVSVGNEQVLRQDAQMLHAADQSILNAYELKAGGKTSRAEFYGMMKRETFMTAQEAIDCGLADGMIDYGGTEAAADPMSVTACIYSAQDLAKVMCALPPIEELMKMRDETEGTGNEEENAMEETQAITTTEELKAAYPELAARITADAREAERQRIADIDEVALPGYENIVEAAKADPEQNAGTVAIAINKAMKQQGTHALEAMVKDAGDSNTNHVPGAAAPEGDEESEEQKIQATVQEDMKIWKEKQ